MCILTAWLICGVGDNWRTDQLGFLMEQDYMQYCADVVSRQDQYRLSFQFQVALRNSDVKNIAPGVQTGPLEQQPETLLARRS